MKVVTKLPDKERFESDDMCPFCGNQGKDNIYLSDVPHKYKCSKCGAFWFIQSKDWGEREYC